MPNQPPSLSAQLAELRLLAPSGATGQAGLYNSIIELIIASLFRLLGRLADMVQLWQDGLLPALPLRPAAIHSPKAPAPRAQRTPELRRHRRAPRARDRAPAAIPLPVRSAPRWAPSRAICIRARAAIVKRPAIIPRRRPRPARDPPNALYRRKTSTGAVAELRPLLFHK